MQSCSLNLLHLLSLSTLMRINPCKCNLSTLLLNSSLRMHCHNDFQTIGEFSHQSDEGKEGGWESPMVIMPLAFPYHTLYKTA